MSNTSNNKSLWQSIKDYVKNVIHRDILVEETVNDVIGNNAKVVIFTLFGLLLASIIMYSILITGKYNPDSIFSQTRIPSEFESSGFDISKFNFTPGSYTKTLEAEVYNQIITSKTNASEKLKQIQDYNEQRITEFQDRFQQVEQIDAVFIAAITGALALGGTLITQLWARRQ